MNEDWGTPANLPAVVAPVGNTDVAAAEPGKALVRDNRGRFLTGNSGGGRPKGARNRLSEAFVAAVADDFAEHGPDALAALRKSDPGAYLRVVASFVPREPDLAKPEEPDLADLTDDEINELYRRSQRHKMIRRALDEGAER